MVVRDYCLIAVNQSFVFLYFLLIQNVAKVTNATKFKKKKDCKKL